MTRKHRITDEDNAVIRQIAQKHVNRGRVVLEGNVRADNHGNETLNLFLMVGDHDLADQIPWADVRKGFELAPDGDAKLDIAISDWDAVEKCRGELLNHLTVIWRNKTLVEITAISYRGEGVVTLYTKEA